MSKRQAAPKPEELIQKLDAKVVTIKEEIEAMAAMGRSIGASSAFFQCSKPGCGRKTYMSTPQ